MKRKARLVAMCVLLALASAGASYTYLSLKAARNLDRAKSKLHSQAGQAPDGTPLAPDLMSTEAGQLAAPVRIGRSTEIVHKVLYGCGHEDTTTTSAPPEMVGLTREELAREVPDWAITEFSESRVVMRQRRATMSPVCEGTMCVGEKDGWVTVFYGTPERRCRPKSSPRAIAVRDLPPSEQEDLRKGIAVSSEQELLRTLEGLAESARSRG